MCWQCLYHIFQNTTHHVLSVRNEKYFVQSSGKIRKTFYKEFYMNLWFRFYYYTIYGWRNNIKKTLLNLNGIFKSAQILHFNCGHFNVFLVIWKFRVAIRNVKHLLVNEDRYNFIRLDWCVQFITILMSKH